jgi:hypothetical protein
MYPPFFKKCVAVTPSDTIAITPAGVCGILVETAGKYTLLLNGDTVAVEMQLAAGIVHMLSVKRVNATGNAPASATGIRALYL